VSKFFKVPEMFKRKKKVEARPPRAPEYLHSMITSSDKDIFTHNLDVSTRQVVRNNQRKEK
jgi:hypothetical protein